MNKNHVFINLNSLDISKQNKKILKKLDISNIQSLLEISLDEIRTLLFENKLLMMEEDFLIFFEDTRNHMLFSTKYFRNRDGVFCHDLGIEYIEISARIRNFLNKISIKYLSEIINFDISLIKSERIGEKTISDFLYLKTSLNLMVKDRVVENYDYDNLSKVCLNVIKELRLKEDIDGVVLFDILYACLVDEKIFESDLNSNLSENEKIFFKLINNETVKNILFNLVLNFIKNSENGVQYNEVVLFMPKVFHFDNMVKLILDNLILLDSIYVEDNLYKFKYETIFDYINILEKDSDRKIVIDRLNGKTLENIASEVNLTRERIRQIVLKIMENRPVVAEDRYKDIYTKYYFEKEQFVFAFGVDDYVYNYLSICYVKGDKMLEECLNDMNLSAREIKGIEKAIYKNFHLLGNEYVKSQRSDLCEYVIRTLGTNELTYEEFVQKYYSLLDELGLRNNETYLIEGRGYQNKLIASDYVLWKYGKKLRYYNIKKYDFAELFSTLDLGQYMNLEISTLLLFRKHKELMNTYDIKDEYELHNLLKKISNNSEVCINFLRMPIIEIGIANRDRQVLDLLTLNAPIDNISLAKKYEEEYGVVSSTVLANCFNEIYVYLHDGIYKMDNPIPSNEILNSLQLILVNDFYSISNARKKILEVYPDLDMKFVNSYVLKTIGFRVYANYIIKDLYPSASEYFRFLLTSKEMFSLKDFSKDMIYLAMFQSEFVQLKLDYEILEYLPSKFVNFKKLRENGITKNDFKIYCDFVWNNVEDGDYFTIHSLFEDGVKNEMTELGFGYLFYASILSECKSKFQYRRIGNNKLFLKGTQTVTLTAFIEFILLKRTTKSINLYDLINLMNERYEILTDKYKIIELLKETVMYYDIIKERIYLSYDLCNETV